MESNAAACRYGIEPETAALVSIDFQVGFTDGSLAVVPDAAVALRNFIGAANYWRSRRGLVYHVRTYFTPDRGPAGGIPALAPDFDSVSNALAEDSPKAAFCAGLVRPEDILVRKTTFSATIGSDLIDQLRSRGIESVVIGGLTTPICVQTTVDGLSMSGFRVMVLEDSCASQPIGSFNAAQAHRAAIERMGYLFAHISNSSDFIGGSTAVADA